MLQVKVNHEFNFEIDHSGKDMTVNNETIVLDIATLSDREAHVLYQNQSFNTEIVEMNKTEKTCKIKVNDSIYTVGVKDQYDQLLKELGLDNLTNNKVSEIRAPMPGLVLNIMVSENDEVKKGDNLLILEAMKMENILKSPTDGIVKKVSVIKGDKVEKNQVLIQFM